MSARFSKKRLETVIDAARDAGARVKVDLVKGEATIDFPASGANLSHETEEGDRIEEGMRAAMGGASVR